MHSNYYQLPPDGTGKKVFARKVNFLNYKERGLEVFEEGDVVVGSASNRSMTVLSVHHETTTGYIVLSYGNEQNEDDATSWTDGEDLIISGKGTVALADGIGQDHYTNTSIITSFDNPYHGLLIDTHGQAYVRFLEGDQLLDGAGKSITSEETKIGDYHFSEDAMASLLSITSAGGGTVEYDIPSHSATLKTTSASGDLIYIQSDKFHPISINQSLYCEFAMQSGDNGKTNLLRRAGLFYELNGFFMELHDLGFKIVHRSNGTGSVVSTHVEQADFNGDPLDGTGLSRYVLDFTKVNKYWMDFHPGVRIRFGTFDQDGARIMIHTILLGNTATTPLINATGLPIRFEIENTDDTASHSQMTVYSSTVSIQGEDSFHRHKFEKSSGEVTCTSAEWTPILSIKPDALMDGNINRALTKLGHMSLSCVTSADGSVDGRVKVELFETPVLDGATFATQRTGSHFLVDTAATGFIDEGHAFTEHLLKGTADIRLDYMDFLETYLCNKADGTERIWTLGCKAIREDVQVLGAFTWYEIEVTS